MLVLSRKTDESIHVGDGIRITVVQVQGNRVKIGIEAPKSVRVFRSELVDAPPTRAGRHAACSPSRLTPLVSVPSI